MAGILDVTDASFEKDVIKSDRPVLVDFWAEWCAPCRMVAPLVKEVAEEYPEQLRVAKMDVDANPNTAARFNVRSIPTLLFFRDGQVVDQLVGAVPKDRIVERVRRISGRP